VSDREQDGEADRERRKEDGADERRQLPQAPGIGRGGSAETRAHAP
jgi:hypothetical protein